ncbi:hypothetical protein B0H16DRAFT_1580635 [Mycena metata]|uniref:Uncharacterized protein n=1 Tax=Mycena metata TaxID=1033252 RepID=A0AAD7I0V3_9AGAR|nr:hypothetical protein B0H16DRAFT_1580635 [Mycena metata]
MVSTLNTFYPHIDSMDPVCDGQVTLSEAFIGADKNVHVQYATCPKYGSKVKTLEARQAPIDVFNLTGATSCFTPSGGGPNCEVERTEARTRRERRQRNPLGNTTNRAIQRRISTHPLARSPILPK